MIVLLVEYNGKGVPLIVADNMIILVYIIRIDILKFIIDLKKSTYYNINNKVYICR